MRHFLSFICLLSFLEPGAQTIRPYSVLITEIMPDPTPSQGLPEAEFVEICNASESSIDLYHWSITDGKSTSTVEEHFLLQPKNFLILCSLKDSDKFQSFGLVLGLHSFPGLNNDQDTLTLISPSTEVIHSVAYNQESYRNEIKSKGGWSLEMLDLSKPCRLNENWRASVNSKGGTPGNQNSMEEILTEDDPVLVRVYTPDSLSVVFQFDRGLDPVSVFTEFQIRLADPVFHVTGLSILPPLYEKVWLKLSDPPEKGKPFEGSIQGIRDCSGGTLSGPVSFRLGLPVNPLSLDLVLNEILFHVLPGETEFIELYNRSEKVIDLSKCFLGSRSAAGNLQNLNRISSLPLPFFPGEYTILTKDRAALTSQYIIPSTAEIIQTNAVFTLPDKKGSIVLTDETGRVIDELDYDEKWQFPLLDDPAGIALERIDPDGETQDPNNWHSAAAGFGNATPGRRNSQFRSGSMVQTELFTETEVFSPDNDGMDDFLSLHYRFSESGNVCNLFILDPSGRPVRYLVRNQLCGTTGMYQWNGLDDQNRSLRTGLYILFAEIFNLRGEVHRYRIPVVLARKRM